MQIGMEEETEQNRRFGSETFLGCFFFGSVWDFFLHI